LEASTGAARRQAGEHPLAGRAYPECALDLRSSAGASHLPARWGGRRGRWPPVRRGEPRRTWGPHEGLRNCPAEPVAPSRAR
jgi:hypothetical protein